MATTNETLRQPPTRDLPKARRRRPRWWHWLLASVLVVLLLIVGATRTFIAEGGPPPLALPAAAASAETTPLDGTWKVSKGSVAGFRVRQSAFGAGSDSVGRTDTVTGTLVIAGDEVSSATFSLDLTTIEVDGTPPPALATSLNTSAEPTATFTLTEPMPLTSGLTTGDTTTGTVTGQLVLRGTSRPVTFDVTERRDGAALRVAGSTPIEFSDFGIVGPKGFGVLGSIADHGTAEILLVLQRK